MDMTPRWALPMLYAGQAQKELIHNEALMRIDMLVHGQVESADRAAPPDAPAPGACWIVAPDPEGVWAGQAAAIAGWTEGGWRFVAPRAGMRVMVADRGHAMTCDGVTWTDAAVRPDGIFLAGERVVGPRAAAVAAPVAGATMDAQARDTINAILEALRAHGLVDT